MEKRQKDPMLSFLIGYADFFLIGLGALRFLKIQENQGYIPAFSGLLYFMLIKGEL